MPADLYCLSVSGPSRTVIMTARQLGVELNMKMVNVFHGDQMKPDFLKINPHQHCIPTLVEEDGFTLWESRTIARYLCTKYAANGGDSLYPTDLRTRAHVDRLLDYDSGSLSGPLHDFWRNPTDDHRDKLSKRLTVLNGFLEGCDYLAGTRTMTIADLSVYSHICYLSLTDFDIPSVAPRLEAWRQRIKSSLPYNHEVNVAPLEDLARRLKERAQKEDKAA